MVNEFEVETNSDTEEDLENAETKSKLEQKQ
jgi:hypothetical protein